MKKTREEFTAAVWRRVEEKREAEKKRARLVRRLSFAAACLLLVIGLFPLILGGMTEKRAANAPRDAYYSLPDGAPQGSGAPGMEMEGAKNPSAANGPQNEDADAAAPSPCGETVQETRKSEAEAPKEAQDTNSPEASAGTGKTVCGYESGPVRFRIRDTETEGLLTDPVKIARLDTLIGALTVKRDPDPQKAGVTDPAAAEIVIGEENGLLVLDGISYRVEQNDAWRELSDFLRRCAEKAE